MREINVRTQAQLDRALARGDIPIIVSDAEFRIDDGVTVYVGGSSAPRIVSWGSSAPRIVSWGSSAPRIESWESSAPRIESWESSAPRIVSWGSSAPRIESRESSAPRIESRESSAVTGTVGKYSLVAVENHGATVDLPGAVMLKTLDEDSTVEEWADYHGVTLDDCRLCVYKAVDDDLRSGYRTQYGLGETITCDDWKDAAACGNGLHFSPHPAMARSYFADATRFLACAVDPRTVVLLGDKLKAPTCQVLFEVDEDGGRIGAATEVEAA